MNSMPFSLTSFQDLPRSLRNLLSIYKLGEYDFYENGGLDVAEQIQKVIEFFQIKLEDDYQWKFGMKSCFASLYDHEGKVIFGLFV